MPVKDDPLLSLEVGGQSVGANVQSAIDSGEIVEHPDGTLSLTTPGHAAADSGTNSIDTFIGSPGDFRQPCGFLNQFLFRHAYAESAVPFGCRNCFKVKVISGNLRQLMAVKEIADTVPQSAKSGMEPDSHFTPHIYSTYFYNIGLDRARALYKDLRARIDRHETLGPTVGMLIKRGCTNYERKCGPSDRYTFDPRLEDIERHLMARFRVTANGAATKLGKSALGKSALGKSARDMLRLFQMVRMAYRLGDDTYKDFTGGKTLYPPVVTYAPDPPGG